MVDPLPLVRVLLLLGIANFTPILAKWLLADRLGAPLDAGYKLPDGRPLFGNSKTIRGVVVSIMFTALAAPLLGFEWLTGAAVATASIVGDLSSSFVKRRLGLQAHAQALGIDQIPEALLPLLLLRTQLDLSALEIVVIVVAFIALELALSPLLYRLHIRDRPY